MQSTGVVVLDVRARHVVWCFAGDEDAMAVRKKRSGVEIDNLSGWKNAFVSSACRKKNEMLLRRGDDCQRPPAVGRECECLTGPEACSVGAVGRSDVDLRRSASSVSPFIEEHRLAVGGDVGSR